ncbi:unnamed protein product [Ostreobium quekettii]|uniref:Uncharacterized protein n=1 Tax=Ostreobium quekettii TaxID=121088 RepID=A0A8S1INW1_9CHLO|nr:unnamed protein product [Ostreobium quekettii]
MQLIGLMELTCDEHLLKHVKSEHEHPLSVSRCRLVPTPGSWRRTPSGILWCLYGTPTELAQFTMFMHTPTPRIETRCQSDDGWTDPSVASNVRHQCSSV